jgi:hypothetical protein
MFLTQHWRDWRRRRKRIRELEKSTTEAFMATYDPDDPIRDAAIMISLTRKDQYELNHLLDAPFLQSARKWGIDIPPDFWERESAEDGERLITLSLEGRNWIKREVGKVRREWAKDWVGILSPVLSSIVAILGLLVALLKGR